MNEKMIFMLFMTNKIELNWIKDLKYEVFKGLF